MAKNSQQFGGRTIHQTRHVNEIGTSKLQRQISELTSMFRQFAIKNAKVVTPPLLPKAN